MIKKQFYLGFTGFLGFLSLGFFFTGKLSTLTYLGFFGFFSNFFIASIKGTKADERYLENQKTAMAFTGQFAIIELMILWAILVIFKNITVMFILLPFGFALTLNVYAIKLYLLEEK